MAVLMSRRNLLAGGLVAAGGVVAARTYLQSRDLAARRAADRAPLPESPALADLVRFATLAPNSHNTQAWRFVPAAGGMTILPDTSRRTPVADADDHHLYASLGAAAETLSLAARARGLGGTVTISPGEAPVAVDLSPGKAEADDLFDAIATRQCCRTIYDGSRLAPEEVTALTAAVRAAGAEAVWVEDEAPVGRLSALIVAAAVAQLENAAYTEELKLWLRFSRAAALRTGDGLFSAAVGSPVVPDLIGPLAFDLTLSSGAEAERIGIDILSSAGLLVILSPSNDPSGWIAAGRACQRAQLRATALGLKSAFLNHPVEIPAMRAEIASLLGTGGLRPSLILRVGRGEAMPYALRRPVTDVLSV